MIRKICVLLCLLFAVTVGTVFAHSVLVSSQPKDGAAVTGPVPKLKLTFNTKIEKVLSLKVIKENGGKERNPKASSDGKFVRTTLQQPLKSGSYEVHYRVIGEDGHAVEGEFSFKVKGSTEEKQDNASAKDKSDDSVAEPSSLNQNEQSQNKGKSKPDDGQSTALNGPGENPVIIGVVIALAIVVMITLVLLLRKKK
ncbi:MAG TPA: copper resistance protein CopC [Bacillales bacterium]